MGLQDHSEVRIVQGVYRAPGDNNSVEFNILSYDLKTGLGGISLEDWSPNMPAIENGGIWTDSPLQNGRDPLVLNEGNVIENMRITINGGSALATAKKYSELVQLMQRARDFYTSPAQIDPVFLHYYAACGAGRQYALIKNMEFKPNFADSTAAIITGSLVIERETYWRFLPPGANPKQWTYEYNNQPYTTAGVSLNTGATDHLVINSTFVNRSQISTDGTSLVVDNCTVIPANKIPGDAPALLEILCSTDITRVNVMLGKKTVKIPVNSGTPGSFYAQNDIFNAADGTMGTDASTAADTGASTSRSGSQLRVAISFATATNQLRWNAASIGVSNNNINRFIGRWMVFMRCRQSAGTVGDITMYLRVGTTVASDSDGQKLNVVYPPVTSGGTGNSTDWGVVYMGIVSIPLYNAKADMYANTISGLVQAAGLNNNDATTLDFGLFALRSTGSAVLYINDLILIPVDEGAMTLEAADGAIGSSGMIYDETGFLTHGTTDQYVGNTFPGGANQQLAKMTGQGIQLTPGVENRIYALQYGVTQLSRVSDAGGYYLNIIPRCRGIRTYSNLAGASASG